MFSKESQKIWKIFKKIKNKFETFRNISDISKIVEN